MTSGAIQKGVPTKVLRWDLMFVNWAATPKSASLTLPVSESKTLAALMSRWILPSLWRYWMPRSSSRQTMAMCVSLKFAGLSCHVSVSVCEGHLEGEGDEPGQGMSHLPDTP